MMMSSETSCPASMTFFAARPSGVPAFTAARNMSPVEICGMRKRSLMKLAWVPLPAPGGPKRISLIVVPRDRGEEPIRRDDLTVCDPRGQTAPARVPDPRAYQRQEAMHPVAPLRRWRSRARARAAVQAPRTPQAASVRAADRDAGNRRGRHKCRCADSKEAPPADPARKPRKHPGPRGPEPG